MATARQIARMDEIRELARELDAEGFWELGMGTMAEIALEEVTDANAKALNQRFQTAKQMCTNARFWDDFLLNQRFRASQQGAGAGRARATETAPTRNNKN